MANVDLSKLFKAAMALDTKVEQAQKAVEAAMEERSKAVKAVFEANGKENGPFNFKGKLYTIRKRDKKEDSVNEKGETVSKPTGEQTWFFVSIGDKAVTSID